MKKNNRKSIKESSTTIERIGDMKKDYRITEQSRTIGSEVGGTLTGRAEGDEIV